ncbi:GIY-YIG nuclease family protein [Priestia megaterium]|uniref:GIY-YIG nuclease family protein n=1 Tax=Priestia megaterium TaxID=1404 RepID=UPI0011A5752F|nr:GIY-YIG nuclease family protein [Priestia megaterium]MCM3016909.1 GIY-YIG nuclease family protein [Priestia megaterium]
MLEKEINYIEEDNSSKEEDPPIQGDTNKTDISNENLLPKEYYVYEYYIVDSNEVFYVGKGKGPRAWKDVRNSQCEKIKSEYQWDVRIIQRELPEEEALNIERELIEKYRSEGQLLTNIMPGGVKPTEKETVGYVKYLLFLVEKGILQMSLSEIANLLLLNQTTVWNIANTDQFSEIEPLILENINEVVHRYHVNSYTEEQVRVGNVKYILYLMDKEVLKLSQAQLGEYFGMTPQVISYIKKEKTHSNIPMLLPENIGDILKKFDVFYVSEEEKKRGMIMFILRLRNEGIIKITNREIGRLLDISDYLIAEFNRTNEDRKYKYKEYRPSEEIMAKIAPYFILK